MDRLRRLALGLGALVTASLAFAVPGAVADNLPVDGMTTLTSAHFQIHFDGDYTKGDFLPSAKANDILGFAERAYSTYTSMGYAAPVDDGDGNGLNEIYVESLLVEPFNHYVGYVEAITPAATTTAGRIHMDVGRGIADPTDPTKIDGHAVAHEVFTLFEWKIFHATDASDRWLEESSAEWAAFQVANTVAPWADSLGEADRAIDCIGSECGYAQPTIAGYNEFYDRLAKPGWSFLQYLGEKYGNDIVKQIWNQAATDGVAIPATQPVNEILAAKGSSLTDAFSGWIAARLNSGFKIQVGGASVPRPTPFATVKTGFVAGATPTQVVATGHLSARYVKLVPGDGNASSSNASCSGASLTVNVAIPAGVTSAPYIFLDTTGQSPQAMTVSGSTATATIPWSTCGSGAPAFVSLPNATTNPAVNGNEFVVTGTVAIDPNARPTAPPPPAPTVMPGTVVNVPSGDVAPTVQLYGPELLRLSATEKQIRLIVASSGPGMLKAALGSLSLGSSTLRAGNNDIRFTLPASALASLRRFSTAANVLTLTPLSPAGVTGKVVTRRVQVEPAPAAKPKAKPAAKPASKKTPAKPKKRTRR